MPLWFALSGEWCVRSTSFTSSTPTPGVTCGDWWGALPVRVKERRCEVLVWQVCAMNGVSPVLRYRRCRAVHVAYSLGVPPRIGGIMIEEQGRKSSPESWSRMSDSRVLVRPNPLPLPLPFRTCALHLVLNRLSGLGLRPNRWADPLEFLQCHWISPCGRAAFACDRREVRICESFWAQVALPNQLGNLGIRSNLPVHVILKRSESLAYR